MKRVIQWIWNHGIIGTFVAGLFALLPIAITVGIMSWVGQQLCLLVSPEGSPVGRAIKSLGLHFAPNAYIASVIGWVLVLSAIWVLGAVIKSVAKNRIENGMNAVVKHIPIVKSVYSTASQLVGMLKKEDQSELKSMTAVFCSFGQAGGGGFLGLMASPETFRFGDREYRVIYIPTSPIPMSGGIVFVAAENVTKVEMSAEQVMRIYFSLGILTAQVVPGTHQVPQAD